MANGTTGGTVDTSLINQSLKAIAQSMGQVAAAITSVFTITGGTAATATAGSATLPSAPAAFGIVTIDGVAYKIPLYNP
jgi:hypothetical protein